MNPTFFACIAGSIELFTDELFVGLVIGEVLTYRSLVLSTLFPYIVFFLDFVPLISLSLTDINFFVQKKLTEIIDEK
jgi:hypothetical protein